MQGFVAQSLLPQCTCNAKLKSCICSNLGQCDMNFQVYGSNTQTCLFDTVSTAATGPTHSFRRLDGPDVRAAMSSLHAPFCVGSPAPTDAPSASRGSATAENFKVVTYNVGAKADIMFSSAQRLHDFKDKTDRDMLLFYQDAVAYARHGVDDRESVPVFARPGHSAFFHARV